MKISVIIPTYNDEDALKSVVESVQKCVDNDDVEIVICDDCSTDDTMQIAYDLKKAMTTECGYYYVEYIQVTSTDQHKGLAATLNTGIRKSSGEYVMILVPPDTYKPHHIESHLSFFKQTLLYKPKLSLIHHNSHPSSLIFKRSVMDVVGWFDEGLGRGTHLPITAFIEKVGYLYAADDIELKSFNSDSKFTFSDYDNLQTELYNWHMKIWKQKCDPSKKMKESPRCYTPPDKSLNIVWIGYIDPGGISTMYKKAIEKYTPHKMRIVTITETRGFDSDIVLQKQLWGGKEKYEDFDSLRTILDDADILLFSAAVGPQVSKYKTRIQDTTDMPLGSIDLKDYAHKKRAVFFYGSTSIRRNYNWYYELYKDWPIITCQPDIHRNLPSTYVPIVVDIDNPRYDRSFFLHDEEVNIIHSPTDRPLKNTDAYESMAEKIEANFGICENMGFKESLDLKRKSHIALDQMQIGDGYYCLSSVENSALGIVNLVYLDEFAKKTIAYSLGTYEMPWLFPSDERSLHDMIKKLVEDRKYRQKKQIETYEWFRRWWHPRYVAGHLARFLEGV